MPFVKGKSGNPGGKPKGAVSLKATLMRLLTPQTADAIVAKLLSDAKDGNHKSIELICELMGEIGKAVPQLAVQINNSVSVDELMDRAKQYALSNGIIDVKALPVSSSISTPVSSSVITINS